ncbi:MAG: cell wall-active antibiotics response protein [candidate division Zixibacteria bacterium]|nr:cell wall-active antibiotics response protein [candidate division Zixibacteria bacterium]
MSNGAKIFGFILIVFGVLLVSRTFGLFYFGIGDLFRHILPIGLMALGLWMIIRKKKKLDCIDAEYRAQESGATFSASTSGQPEPPPASGTGPESAQPYTTSTGEQPFYREAGRLKYSKFIGDMNINCTNLSLENIEVSSVIGDVDVNLTGGKLGEGLNRMIFSGFIGDIRIMIPKDFAVFAHCSNFIGDIDVVGRRASGFGNNIDWQSDNYDSADSKLYIAANNFLGDIKIFQV